MKSRPPTARPGRRSAPAFPRAVGGFVGRRAELDRMLARIDDDALFFVYGVSGIGKSELVYRLIEEVRARPEWRDATPIHLDVRPGATTARLLAELLDAAGAPPEPRRGQPTEREHGVEQLVALGRILDARPFLLFIDDVHHLPADSVGRALHHLARRVRASRLFLASRREIPLPPDAPPPVITTLGPLDAGAATQMSDALADRLQVPRPNPHDLMRSSRGSPFHIRRLLVGHTPDDDSLDESLTELSEPARRLLLCAALAPQPPTLEALSAASSGIDLDLALADLRQRFLLDADERRATVHDLVREAALRLASPEELRAAQGDCARLCLEQLHRGDAPSLIHAVDAVTLYLAAGRPSEAWALVERWHSPLAAAGTDHLLLDALGPLRAALPERRAAIDLLTARCLVRASLFERADAVLTGIDGALDADQEARFFALSGEIAQRSGDLARAEALFDRSAARAPDEAVRFQARLQTAIVAMYRGEGERARERLDAALAELSAPTPLQLARLGWARTLSWMFEERFERGAEEAQRTREALPDHGLEDVANRLAMLETLAAIEGDDMRIARAAAQRIDEAGLRRRVASLYRAFVGYADGDARRASGALIDAHDSLSAQGDTMNAYLAAYYGSAALAEIGSLAEARALSERGAELARRAGLLSLVARSLAQQALLAAEAVQSWDAHRLADEALGTETVGPRSRARAHCAHAHAFTIEGDLTGALEHVGLARAAVVDLPSAHASIDVEHAAVELVGGRFDGAVERAERAADRYRDGSRDYEAARAQLILAASYLARGRRTDLLFADRTIARARELAQRGELRSILVGCAILSAALARRGDRARAADELLAEALIGLDPERGSLCASTLVAAIEGGAAAAVVPGAVALLAHLGFRDAVECFLVDRRGRRAASRQDVARERGARELVVDELDELIVAGRGAVEIRGRPMQCAMLSALIQARGEEVSAEALYKRVWGVSEYHPLQHRNALYVAINRLRNSLREALPEREVVERSSQGWRLADGVDACAAISAREPR